MGRLLPAGHGFEFICFLLETRWGIPLFCFLCGTIVSWLLNGGWVTFIVACIVAPLTVLLFSVTLLFCSSYIGASGPSDWDEYITVKDPAMKKNITRRKFQLM